MVRHAVALVMACMLGSCTTNMQNSDQYTPGSVVKLVEQPDGSFALLRDGEPYAVKGAGYGSGPGLSEGKLAMLAAAGGNTIRTWGIEQLEQEVDGKSLLDRAHELGISVMAGFWVQHVRHGFDYGNPTSIEQQRARLRDAVLKYRDHPALLAWGLGNEMEAFAPDQPVDRIWRELNHLAGIIKDLDRHHPVVTVVAEVSPQKIDDIHEHYPNLDILGVNAYGGAPSVGKRLLEAGWSGPYMLTEFGVTGTWESATTKWDAPIESDPSTKALETYTHYLMDRDNNVGRSLGSFVFIWGHKQEATATWFGMFLPTGEKLPRVDAMAFAWTGQWPADRAPKLISLESPVGFQRVKADTQSFAEVDCIDREGGALTYSWDIVAESTDRKTGGDAETAPPSFSKSIIDGQGTPRIEFATPSRSGAYRLFVTAYDENAGAVVHNLPFFVE